MSIPVSALPGPDELNPDWYIQRDIPEKLLTRLGRVPYVPEELIDAQPNAARLQLVERRKHGELTQRELHILALLSHGMTSQMAADTTGVGIEYVKDMLKRARYVLRAKNTAHAIAIALREELID